MKKKILIVDDKESIAKVVKFYLSDDFDFMWCPNPVEAIAWLNDGNMPDLIISDIRMPLMSGAEFLKFLKNNEFLKEIPVILLSSEDSTSERIKLLEQGASDYIVKPFNPLEIKVRVKKILG
ncbi:MAG: response regulator transcription factor [Bacteroidales bacterium]|jgi:DNA-binding response OmpR family regulator|nr:response regulator transcription factor [Bacteroidales bacterium]